MEFYQIKVVVEDAEGVLSSLSIISHADNEPVEYSDVEHAKRHALVLKESLAAGEGKGYLYALLEAQFNMKGVPKILNVMVIAVRLVATF